MSTQWFGSPDDGGSSLFGSKPGGVGDGIDGVGSKPGGTGEGIDSFGSNPAGTDGIVPLGSKLGGTTDGIVSLGSKPGAVGEGIDWFGSKPAAGTDGIGDDLHVHGSGIISPTDVHDPWDATGANDVPLGHFLI